MNDVAAMRDPFLDLALDGVRLIEASAGTGKTFTLATLVTRLVIEGGLRVGEVLAVTFTEAATQELRERLRQRFALAARMAAGEAPQDGDAADVALTRALIDSQLQHESADALRARLQRAAREIDLSAVFTIHGFCARVLQEHALETGQALTAPQMVGSDRDLIDTVAIDLWRCLGADPTSAELLPLQWPSGPDALAADLGALLRTPRLLPPLPTYEPDPLPGLQRSARALHEAFLAHGDDLRGQIDAAIAGKHLNANSYRPGLTDELWNALRTWCAAGDAVRAVDARLERLTPAMLTARTNKGKRTPCSPLCDAVATHLAAIASRDRWLAAHVVALVHRVRSEAAARLAALKQLRRQRTYDDLIDGVAAALEGPHADRLVDKLRAQYAFALVDEFQDTDARQWAIFERVFGARPRTDGHAPALFLIGDPKQAIYRFRGGDVHTYLHARRGAIAAPPLDRNFRSRPSLLRAIAALYERVGHDAFVDDRIRFHPVTAGGRVADETYQRRGRSAPALDVCVLPPPDGRSSWKSDESRVLATRACVAAIHALLDDANAGRATIDGHPVQPGDIAVLVREHRDAARVQAALSAAGIPAVAAGRQSLFATVEAQELLALFEALLQPGDDARLRGALSTVLLGFDAPAITRLDDEQDWHRAWQLRALGWRERWQHHGPLALVADLCAEHAPRLLGLVDGERRLTNLLQLAEVLQEADARALGLHGLVDWLRTRIVEADDNDESQQLRLESDAQRVQILTLHTSKGLEFPLVFLPFAGIGKDPRNGRWCEYATEQGRVLQLKTAFAADGTPGWDEARATATGEERAEDARLLYVGLTRARHAVWVATGPLYLAEAAPLTAMLGDAASLQTSVAGDIVVDDSGLPPARMPQLPAPAADTLPPARIAQRTLSRDWWVYSFTQLTNEASANLIEERGAEDEPESLPLVSAPASGEPPFDRRFSGSRFGNVLHAALEHVDFEAWRDACSGTIPTAQDGHLRTALRGEGYAEADLEDGMPFLAALVGQTLNAELPEGARLCDLPHDARRAEMEFHFALQPTDVAALLATLHAHGVLRERHAFGARRRLEGLMTGKIDLVYVFAGRYYLLDYKSNRLPAYDRASLDAAMESSEYTLQALIYALALHRWLRFRHGDGYDYERDFGGVRYVFCRGLDVAQRAVDGDRHGMHAHKPPRALIDTLDALFAAGSQDP